MSNKTGRTEYENEVYLNALEEVTRMIEETKRLDEQTKEHITDIRATRLSTVYATGLAPR